MFNAASTAPAPSPYGIENRQIMTKELDIENPNRAIAVVRTLIAVTSPAPSFLVILSESKLDTTVPAEIIIETIPAYDSCALRSVTIIGQAEPSKESGKPRLINDKYIIASKIENIKTP